MPKIKKKVKKIKKKVTKTKKKKDGRPTKWKKEYNEAIIKYFNRPLFKKILKIIEQRSDDKDNIVYETIPNYIPTFHDFAETINVNEDTVVEWAKEENEKKYPGFSAAYNKAKKKQKWFLINNTLNGNYNSTFAIFLATNITDMRNRKSFEHAGKDGGKIEIESTRKLDNDQFIELSKIVSENFKSSTKVGDGKGVDKDGKKKSKG